VNFPFICSNIPAAPEYGVNISQSIRYSRACGSYQDFLDRVLLLKRKLLNQWFLLVNFIVATMTWLTVMEYLCHKWPRTCSTCRKHFPVLSFSLLTLGTRHKTKTSKQKTLTQKTKPMNIRYPMNTMHETSWEYLYMYTICIYWFIYFMKYNTDL